MLNFKSLKHTFSKENFRQPQSIPALIFETQFSVKSARVPMVAKDSFSIIMKLHLNKSQNWKIPKLENWEEENVRQYFV